MADAVKPTARKWSILDHSELSRPNVEERQLSRSRLAACVRYCMRLFSVRTVKWFNLLEERHVLSTDNRNYFKFTI